MTIEEQAVLDKRNNLINILMDIARKAMLNASIEELEEMAEEAGEESNE